MSSLKRKNHDEGRKQAKKMVSNKLERTFALNNASETRRSASFDKGYHSRNRSPMCDWHLIENLSIDSKNRPLLVSDILRNGGEPMDSLYYTEAQGVMRPNTDIAALATGFAVREYETDASRNNAIVDNNRDNSDYQNFVRNGFKTDLNGLMNGKLSNNASSMEIGDTEFLLSLNDAKSSLASMRQQNRDLLAHMNDRYRQLQKLNGRSTLSIDKTPISSTASKTTPHKARKTTAIAKDLSPSTVEKECRERNRKRNHQEIQRYMKKKKKQHEMLVVQQEKDFITPAPNRQPRPYDSKELEEFMRKQRLKYKDKQDVTHQCSSGPCHKRERSDSHSVEVQKFIELRKQNERLSSLQNLKSKLEKEEQRNSSLQSVLNQQRNAARVPLSTLLGSQIGSMQKLAWKNDVRGINMKQQAESMGNNSQPNVVQSFDGASGIKARKIRVPQRYICSEKKDLEVDKNPSPSTNHQFKQFLEDALQITNGVELVLQRFPNLRQLSLLEIDDILSGKQSLPPGLTDDEQIALIGVKQRPDISYDEVTRRPHVKLAPASLHNHITAHDVQQNKMSLLPNDKVFASNNDISCNRTYENARIADASTLSKSPLQNDSRRRVFTSRRNNPPPLVKAEVQSSVIVQKALRDISNANADEHVSINKIRKHGGSPTFVDKVVDISPHDVPSAASKSIDNCSMTLPMNRVVSNALSYHLVNPLRQTSQQYPVDTSMTLPINRVVSNSLSYHLDNPLRQTSQQYPVDDVSLSLSRPTSLDVLADSRLSDVDKWMELDDGIMQSTCEAPPNEIQMTDNGQNFGTYQSAIPLDHGAFGPSGHYLVGRVAAEANAVANAVVSSWIVRNSRGASSHTLSTVPAEFPLLNELHTSGVAIQKLPGGLLKHHNGVDGSEAGANSCNLLTEENDRCLDEVEHENENISCRKMVPGEINFKFRISSSVGRCSCGRRRAGSLNAVRTTGSGCDEFEPADPSHDSELGAVEQRDEKETNHHQLNETVTVSSSCKMQDTAVQVTDQELIGKLERCDAANSPHIADKQTSPVGQLLLSRAPVMEKEFSEESHGDGVSFSKDSSRGLSSWTQEMAIFGENITESAKKLVHAHRLLQQQKKYLAEKRMESLREYVEAELAYIHLQKRYARDSYQLSRRSIRKALSAALTAQSGDGAEQTSKPVALNSSDNKVPLLDLSRRIEISDSDKGCKNGGPDGIFAQTRSIQRSESKLISNQLPDDTKGDHSLSIRVQALRAQLEDKRLIAAKLKKEYKNRNVERLQMTENSILRQINAYDNYIQNAQEQILSLENESDHHCTPPVILSSRKSSFDHMSPRLTSTSARKEILRELASPRSITAQLTEEMIDLKNMVSVDPVVDHLKDHVATPEDEDIDTVDEVSNVPDDVTPERQLESSQRTPVGLGLDEDAGFDQLRKPSSTFDEIARTKGPVHEEYDQKFKQIDGAPEIDPREVPHLDSFSLSTSTDDKRTEADVSSLSVDREPEFESGIGDNQNQIATDFDETGQFYEANVYDHLFELRMNKGASALLEMPVNQASDQGLKISESSKLVQDVQEATRITEEGIEPLGPNNGPAVNVESIDEIGSFNLKFNNVPNEAEADKSTTISVDTDSPPNPNIGEGYEISSPTLLNYADQSSVVPRLLTFSGDPNLISKTSDEPQIPNDPVASPDLPQEPENLDKAGFRVTDLSQSSLVHNIDAFNDENCPKDVLSFGGRSHSDSLCESLSEGIVVASGSLDLKKDRSQSATNVPTFCLQKSEHESESTDSPKFSINHDPNITSPSSVDKIVVVEQDELEIQRSHIDEKVVEPDISAHDIKSNQTEQEAAASKEDTKTEDPLIFENTLILDDNMNGGGKPEVPCTDLGNSLPNYSDELNSIRNIDNLDESFVLKIEKLLLNNLLHDSFRDVFSSDVPQKFGSILTDSTVVSKAQSFSSVDNICSTPIFAANELADDEFSAEVSRDSRAFGKDHGLLVTSPEIAGNNSNDDGSVSNLIRASLNPNYQKLDDAVKSDYSTSKNEINIIEFANLILHDLVNNSMDVCLQTLAAPPAVPKADYPPVVGTYSDNSDGLIPCSIDSGIDLFVLINDPSADLCSLMNYGRFDFNFADPNISSFSFDEESRQIASESFRIFVTDLIAQVSSETISMKTSEISNPFLHTLAGSERTSYNLNHQRSHFRGALTRMQKKLKGSKMTESGVKELVQNEVLEYLSACGPKTADGNYERIRKVARKKIDSVDQILLDEIYDEELSWADFQEDEMQVIQCLSDNIFSGLLEELGHLNLYS